MRKFIVNVNGTSYEVEVEEMQNVPANGTQSVPKAASAAPAASAPAGGETVSAPMPGTIKRVAVSANQQVKKGDVLFILEAMKLENEIMSPCSGKVTSVCVSEGATVNPGDILCTIA